MKHLLQARTLGGRVLEEIVVEDKETPTQAVREAQRTRPGQHIHYILSIGGPS